MLTEISETDKPLENRHAVTSKDLCEAMGRKYGWKLLRVEPTTDPTLCFMCVFLGVQTSFQDDKGEVYNPYH